MKTIDKDTKISRLIKANQESVEAIASVAKPLRKLRNPILQKFFAGRTTLAEAARIGGCELNDLVEVLKPLGFEWKDDSKQDDLKENLQAVPDFVKKLDAYPKTFLDVRADLASGKDPLKMIMASIKTMPSGNVLHLINAFEPTPLISLLKKKGFESYIDKTSADEVHAYFKLKDDKDEKQQDLDHELPDLTAENTFNEKLALFGAQTNHVDVSEMEMPMPMVTILEALENLPENYALSVQHKRIPVFLFNELKERSCNYLVCKVSDTNVKLLIWK